MRAIAQPASVRNCRLAPLRNPTCCGTEEGVLLLSFVTDGKSGSAAVWRLPVEVCWSTDLYAIQVPNKPEGIDAAEAHGKLPR